MHIKNLKILFLLNLNIQNYISEAKINTIENYDKVITELVNNIPEKVFDTMLNKSENMLDNKIKFKQNLINNKVPVAYIESYLNILKSSDKRLEDLKEFIGEILINIYNLNNEDEISDIFKDEKEILNIRFIEF